jgi:hypothetical protein
MARSILSSRKGRNGLYPEGAARDHFRKKPDKLQIRGVIDHVEARAAIAKRRKSCYKSSDFPLCGDAEG